MLLDKWLSKYGLLENFNAKHSSCKHIFSSRMENSVDPYQMASLDLFDLILYVPSTIFQLYRDGSSWVEPVLS